MLDALGPCSHREDSNSTNHVNKNTNYTTNSTGSKNSTHGNNNDNKYNGAGHKAAIAACRSMALWTESHSASKHQQMVGQASP